MRMSGLTTSAQYCFGGSSEGNLARKWNKNIQIRQEEVQLFPFADDMVLHTENAKGIQTKTPLLNNNPKKFSGTAGLKINMEKSIIFLYTGNK